MQAAWIAFAGVVIGAIIGFLGPVLTTRLSIRAQMDTAALNTFLTARINAYRDCEIALEAWSNEPTDENAAAFYRASNAAALVASDMTIQNFSPLTDMIAEYPGNGGETFNYIAFQKQHLILLHSMRQDLLSYPTPAPVRSRKEDASKSHEHQRPQR